ncbi:MAG: hypothetical protein M3281_00035, partial [Chloroflexota bacterium]|nr:hypothetical protein [Chloroflexota bacterium]
TNVTTTSSGTTVTRKSRREGLKEPEFLNRPDTVALYAGSEVFTMDTTATDQNLQRLRHIFVERPDLQTVIHSLYALDEPMQRNMSLSELQKIYRAHKAVFPEIPVFVVYNQSRTMADSDGDGLSDGLLGQPENPYGPDVADIVGLNIYSASNPNYDYDAIRQLYTHARRVVNSVSASIPIWAVPQVHGLVTRPANTPRPHHLYRQANDWFRAGPDTGLRGFDGLLWYSWHFDPGSVQELSDLEDNAPNRQMAARIGQRIASGAMVTHMLPYRPELYVPDIPSSTLRVPRSGHLQLRAGTIQLSISHLWPGNDGLRHVLLDTGSSQTKDRLLLEKTADNILRLVVIDVSGTQRWTGVRVDTYNMPGAQSYSPGYSEIVATWDNGDLRLYLDGAKAALGGGDGTGVLSSGGSYIYVGTDLAGGNGAGSTFGYLTVRGAALADRDVIAWTMDRQLAYAPAPVVLSTPVDAASTGDSTPTLAWAGVAGAHKYQVQVALDLTFSNRVRDVNLTATSYTPASPLVDGRTYYWRVRALDDYGASTWSAANQLVVPDVTAPSVAAPAQTLVASSTLGTSTIPVALRWSATDTGTGVAQFQMQQRSYTNGVWSSWGWVTQGTTATTVTRKLAPGAYQFQLRAMDGAGNWSSWKVGTSFKLVAYQEGSTAPDGAITYTGTWSRESNSSHLGGYVRWTNVKARVASFRFTGARQVAWVAPGGVDRGYAYVYLDGTKVATVSLYSSSALYRRVVYTRAWSGSGTHTLKVYVTGTKPAASKGARVDIDAFVVLR